MKNSAYNWTQTMVDERDSDRYDFIKRFRNYCNQLNTSLNNSYDSTEAIERLDFLLVLNEKDYTIPLSLEEINSLHPLLKEYLETKKDYFKHDE